MSLSHDIISEFVKVTNNNKEKPKEGIVYATIVQGSDGKYVKIDGSDLLTPADTTTDIEDGERVTVMIKDHKATVTGNVTSPSASGNRVDKVVDTVTEQIGVFETVVADKISVNELEAYKIIVEELIAGKATIEDLEATNAVIENLKVKDAEIENAVIDKATIEDLEAVNAKIENLEVKDAEIENAVIDNLEATKAEIKILNADFAQIKTLVSGNLTSDNILSFNITADKVTMEDAFIKDAMIANVNAAKINAGRINTNSVVIGSEDGGMSISGATQQFTDKNGKVRIQIGRDASDDFTFALYGEDGRGQLINQNGITASAISDGIIVNDMISDDASISGGKLDISSVVTEINNDNTTTIKSNKIYLDEQNQSLEVAFNSLKTQVDTIKDVTIDGDLTAVVEQVQSNTSKIEVNKSSIQTLISEDTVIKKQVTDLEGNLNETTTTLESKYTTLNQNLDGFKTTVADTYATKTSINDVKNDLSANYSTTSTMNSAINQKVDEITASVSSTYATKNEVKTIDDNIRSNYSTTEQMESAISIAKNEISLGISQIYETKNEVQNKIDNVQVGGTNLWVLSDLESGFENIGDIRYDNTSHKIRKTLIPTNGSRTLVYQCWNENLITNTANTNRVAFYGNDREYISNQQVLPLSGNKYQLQLIDIPENTRYVRLAAICGSENGVYDSSIKIKFEFGNKPTSYNFAPEDIESDFVNIGNELQNIETDIKTNYSTTEQMESAINIAKDSINLNVSNLRNEISSSSYKNLLFNSDFNYNEDGFPMNYTSTNRQQCMVADWTCLEGGNTVLINTPQGQVNWTGWYSHTIKASKDQSFTASAYVATDNINNFDDVIGLEIEWLDHNKGRISTSGSTFNLNANYTWERKWFTDVAPNGTVYARIYAWHRQGGTTWWGKPMLQMGRNCTAWDRGGDFDELDRRVKNAEIKITDEAIIAAVSSTYETKTNIENKINDIQNNISNSKNEAINTANNNLNSTIANYYTRHETDSRINLAKDEINLGVSQTYETKDSVNNKMESTLSSAKTYADSQISLAKDAINLGVSNFKSEMMSASFTNLLYNSDFVKMENDFPKGYIRTSSTCVYNGGWLCPEGGKTIHIYTIGTGATWQGFYSPSVRVNKDQTMTASVYVATENKDALQGLVGVEIEWIDANYQRINVSGYSCKLDQNHLWYRISATGSAPEGTVYARVYCWNSFEGATWWGKPMLQIGSVCTAWNKGGDFENLDERLSSAEIKITDDSITNLVKQNFYTKSETEGQITSKGYQTSSQVQQTVDALQIKFTQKGGYNLIRNGGFEKGDAHWYHNNSPTIIGDQSWQNYDGKSMLLQAHSWGSGLYQIFPTTPYKVYSYSFYAQAEHDTWFVGIENLAYSTVEVSPNDWRYYSGTFTATGTSHVFVIYPNGGNRNIYIDNVMVCEGSMPSVYTPHPSEVYDGITTIDKDGITVKGADQAYTNFNSAGMNSFNNSGQQTLGIRNGGITFHPYNTTQLGAYVTQSALWGGSAAANGLAISTANNGTYISLGTSSLSDANTSLSMDQALTISASDGFQPRGINFWKDVHAHGYGIRQLAHLQLAGSAPIQFDYLNTSPSTIYEATSSGHSLYVMGGYQMHLGCMDGTGTPKGLIWMQNSTNTHSYTHWNFHNYTMYNMKTATSYANTLTNRYIETYGINSNVDGIRYLYRNIELVDGVGIRNLPNGYKGCPYDIVSIVCKGRGHAWVECEDEYRFIINGDCKSVNVEIIIYPTDGVMTMSSLAPDESPTLEDLPKRNISEQPVIITNEDFISVESEQE